MVTGRYTIDWKVGLSGWTKRLEPSLSVVFCSRSEARRHGNKLTMTLPRRSLWLSIVNVERRLEIDSLIDENGLSDNIVVYKDGSEQWGSKAYCGYTAGLHGDWSLSRKDRHTGRSLKTERPMVVTSPWAASFTVLSEWSNSCTKNLGAGKTVHIKKDCLN